MKIKTIAVLAIASLLTFNACEKDGNNDVITTDTTDLITYNEKFWSSRNRTQSN